MLAILYVCIILKLPTNTVYGRSRYGRRTGLRRGTTRLMGRAQSKHPNYWIFRKRKTMYSVSIFLDVFGLIFSYFVVVCFCFNVCIIILKLPNACGCVLLHGGCVLLHGGCVLLLQMHVGACCCMVGACCYSDTYICCCMYIVVRREKRRSKFDRCCLTTDVSCCQCVGR